MVHTSVVARTRFDKSLADDRTNIVVVDSHKLRGACLIHLLDTWAAANGLTVVAVSAPDKLGAASNCCMVVLSVGGSSVFELEPQFWMRMARTVHADTPLVILSDREDTAEICGAFKDGAKGYISTSLDPAVALEALSFVRRGGSFFPTSALQVLDAQTDPRVPRPYEAMSGEWSRRTVVRISARFAAWKGPASGAGPDVVDVNEKTAAPTGCGSLLTPRQSEVLERLREGKSNKLIARDLNMTEATVKVHVRQIMHKFGAKNRTQAVLCATRLSSGEN